MAKYILVANPTEISGGLYGGRVLSSHRTLTGAARAHERAQGPTRRANPGCHLDLRVLVAADEHHGTRVDRDEWLLAMAEIQAR